MQRTAFEWKKRTGERLWQSSYHDHVRRGTESTRQVVRYLLENPVRAALVEWPGDYPHCGSLTCSREELIEWAFVSRDKAEGKRESLLPCPLSVSLFQPVKDPGPASD